MRLILLDRVTTAVDMILKYIFDDNASRFTYILNSKSYDVWDG